MENKFVILARYETRTLTGKTWTKWFVYHSKPLIETEANEVIVQTKKNFGFIDQKLKLKHEYILKDYNEYLKDREELANRIEELNKKQEEYFKSDAYKELQKKKRQAAKERKEKQKKYLLKHQNN